MPFQQNKTKIILAVRVNPNARRSGFEGLWNQSHLKVALTAPPVDGKANEALIEFLSDFFNLRKSAITLVSGQTGRIKKLELSFLSQTDSDKALQKLKDIIQ